MAQGQAPVTDKDKHLGYEALALGIALVWGSTFIFQKMGYISISISSTLRAVARAGG